MVFSIFGVVWPPPQSALEHLFLLLPNLIPQYECITFIHPVIGHLDT